jgi:hypothetical protein
MHYIDDINVSVVFEKDVSQYDDGLVSLYAMCFILPDVLLHITNKVAFMIL